MDDEKPFDLRDKLAIEILNGILSCGRDTTSNVVSDLLYYLMPEFSEDDDKGTRERAKENAKWAELRMENLIRSCYKTADIMRKVRLSVFE